MKQVNPKTAYLLWCLWFFGLGGIQRFYTGHFFIGLFYLLTAGGFGIGQIIDLVLIPNMVEGRNRHLAALPGRDAVPLPQVTLSIGKVPQNPFQPQPQSAKTYSPMQKLIRAAQEHGGELSMAQAVLYTEMEPEDVNKVLLDAQRSGVAEIFNDPSTGAIRYRFDL